MEIEIVEPANLGNELEPNDPNSLFKTLAHAIHGDINKYIDVRLEIGKHLCKNINTIFDEMTKRNIEDEYKSKSTKGEELDEYICDLIENNGTQKHINIILKAVQMIYNIKIINYVLLYGSMYESCEIGINRQPIITNIIYQPIIINIFYNKDTGNYFYNKEKYLETEKKRSGRIDVFRFQIDGYKGYSQSMTFGKLRKSKDSDNDISKIEYEMDRSKDILHTSEKTNKYYKMYTYISTKQKIKVLENYNKQDFLRTDEINKTISKCFQKLKQFTDIVKITKELQDEI